MPFILFLPVEGGFSHSHQGSLTDTVKHVLAEGTEKEGNPGMVPAFRELTVYWRSTPKPSAPKSRI